LFKEVEALDAPYIGRLVLETSNVIVVFGEGDDRYDVLKSEILNTKKDDRVLIGLPLYEIARRYKTGREAALPMPAASEIPKGSARRVKEKKNTPLSSSSKSFIGKKVKSSDGEFVGHVIAEFDKVLAVFGHHHYRFDIPKSKIRQAADGTSGKDVVLNNRYEEAFQYSRIKGVSANKRKPIWRLSYGG
jgi:hypothetical protein